VRVLRGLVATPWGVMPDWQVEYQGGLLTYVGPERPATGVETWEGVVSPGFLDTHIHGWGGVDVMEASAREMAQLSQTLATMGVTGFLATLQTHAFPKTLEALGALGRLPSLGGARLLGVHMEGPYLSPQRLGAQRPHPRQPQPGDLESLLQHPHLKRITLAPETTPKGFIEALNQHGVAVSAGHTQANYTQAMEAFEAGVGSVTHLWNAMVGIHHREPGIVGAALHHRGVLVELIGDCVHVHPPILGLTVRLKGPHRALLCSDGIPASGLPDGYHALHGRRFQVIDGVPRLETGGLAGGSVGLDEAVRRMVSRVGLEAWAALVMASETPARLLGLEDVGRLEAGRRADLVLLSPGLEVEETVVGGRPVYRRG